MKYKKILISSALLSVLFSLVQLILFFFNLQLRAWVNVIWLSLCILGFVTGVIGMYITTKRKKVLYGMLAAVVLGILVFITPLCFYAAMFLEQIPHKEYVLEIDGYKFVGYEDDFWDDFIDFFDYKNCFVSGNKKRFTAHGKRTDDNGNIVFYDELYEFKHLEDIYEYKSGDFDIDELTQADNTKIKKDN